MNTNPDFSTFNFEYFLKVRDLALKDAETAISYLGVSQEFNQLITHLDTSALVELSRIKQPLVIPHQEPWWWNRLFIALKSGRPEEIALILEQASMITSRSGGSK